MGAGHNLQKHATILIRGGRRRDIPNMRYTGIRGTLDFKGLYSMRNARSKYGVRQL